MHNCESLSILLVTKPEQNACRGLKSKPGIHSHCIHKKVGHCTLGNKLDFEFLQKSGPYFQKIQLSLLQSKSWLGTCACRVVKVGLPNFSAFHFIQRNTFNLFSINLIATYLAHPLFIINLT